MACRAFFGLLLLLLLLHGADANGNHLKRGAHFMRRLSAACGHQETNVAIGRGCQRAVLDWGVRPAAQQRGDDLVLNGLNVPLPGGQGDAQFHTKAHEARTNGFFWHGQDADGGQIVLTQRDDIFAGSLAGPRGNFRIFSDPSNPSEVDIIWVDPLKLKNGHGVVPPTEQNGEHGATVHDHDHGHGHAEKSREADPAAVEPIDVLFLYTPQVLTRAGSVQAVELQMQHAVDWVNVAYANSGMVTRQRLAGVRPARLAESGNINTDLTAVTNEISGRDANGDGFVLSTERNNYCADIVSLVIASAPQTAGVSGIAWVMQATSGFQNSVVSTVLYDYLPSVFAHESGHNLGCVHNVEDSSFAGVNSIAFGHRICATGGFTTIMAYYCPSIRVTAIPHYSNPAVMYGSQPTGTTSSVCTPNFSTRTAPCRNCAAAIDSTSAAVAAYRNRAACAPTTAPSPRPAVPAPRPAAPTPVLAAPSPRPAAPSPRPAAPSPRPAPSAPVALTAGALQLWDVQLNRPATGAGLLRVYYNNIWRPVCDDGANNGPFTVASAQVACKQMGFKYLQSGYTGANAGTTAFWLDNVSCTGTEATLAQCAHNPWGTEDCGSYEGILLQCTNTAAAASATSSQSTLPTYPGSASPIRKAAKAKQFVEAMAETSESTTARTVSTSGSHTRVIALPVAVWGAVAVGTLALVVAGALVALRSRRASRPRAAAAQDTAEENGTAPTEEMELAQSNSTASCGGIPELV